ncbi:radical SAM protein, partial [bacterium]|nr:radical SAM protein [bacterium]
MSWKQSLSYLRVVKGILHGSRAYGGPIQASLSITNRCNIQCIHCYFYSPYIELPNLIKLRRAKQTSQELPDDDEFIALQKLEANTDRTVSLIDELIKLGTVHFHFSGSGEPFLHKSILEFLARVKHANCTCSVNTAGHLLDQE